MLIFLFIVTIFSTANVYFFLKISAILNSGTAVNVFIGTVILFMALSPVLIPVYSHKGTDRAVTIFSYAGYLWLAFLVPFFSIGVLLDLYNVVIKYSGLFIEGDINSFTLTTTTAFLVSFMLSVAILIYGYFEAKNVRVERLVMRTHKLPEGTGKIRVAQISDLHLGVIVRESLLNRVIKIIDRESPDIIVSTGDLLDGITRHVDHLAARLGEMQAGLGKYAVFGNHEIYGGIKKTAQFIKDAGFTLLRGKGVTEKSSINIAGVDFTGGEARRHRKISPPANEHKILSGLPSDLYTILLKHRSDIEEESIGLFDLQLSGHSHKGQIFPMSLATMFLFSYHTGFHRLKKGSAIYTSRGTGTAGPPIRFLSTPEITIIDIVPE